MADETTLPTLVPGSGRMMKAWLWAHACDDRPFGGSGPPTVAHRFEDSRGGKCVARHLAGFSGILQVDGYSAYTCMLKERAKSGSNETIKLAGCWAHLRRKFYELHFGGINRLLSFRSSVSTGLARVAPDSMPLMNAVAAGAAQLGDLGIGRRAFASHAIFTALAIVLLCSHRKTNGVHNHR